MIPDVRTYDAVCVCYVAICKRTVCFPPLRKLPLAQRSPPRFPAPKGLTAIPRAARPSHWLL